MRELGIDRVRITASWSSLTRAPEEETKPEGFDAADPGAYEQARWAGLDTAIRAIRAAGLKALVDIGFWAPHWATDDPPGPRARSNIDPQAYADFATAVALRYSGAFTPPPDAAGRAAARADARTRALDRRVHPAARPVPGARPAAAAAAAAAARGRRPRRQAAAAAARARAAAEGRPLHHLERAQPPGPAAAAVEGRRHDARQPAPSTARCCAPATPPSRRCAARATVLIGNTSSTGGERGTGPVAPLEFLRELACVDAQAQAAHDRRLRGLHAAARRRLGAPPVLPERAPVAHAPSPTTEPGDLRLADTPVLAKTLDRLVKIGRLAPANRNIHLTEFGYETKGIPGRPRVNETQQARWMTWAEYLADRVPTVRCFAQFLLRDQPPAPVRVSQSDERGRSASTRPACCTSTATRRSSRGRSSPASSRSCAARARCSLYGRLRLGAGPKVIVAAAPGQGRRLEADRAR